MSVQYCFSDLLFCYLIREPLITRFFLSVSTYKKEKCIYLETTSYTRKKSCILEGFCGKKNQQIYCVKDPLNSDFCVLFPINRILRCFFFPLTKVSTSPGSLKGSGLRTCTPGILYVSFVEVCVTAPDLWNRVPNLPFPAEKSNKHKVSQFLSMTFFGWNVLAKWDILTGDVYFII